MSERYVDKDGSIYNVPADQKQWALDRGMRLADEPKFLYKDSSNSIYHVPQSQEAEMVKRGYQPLTETERIAYAADKNRDTTIVNPGTAETAVSSVIKSLPGYGLALQAYDAVTGNDIIGDISRSTANIVNSTDNLRTAAEGGLRGATLGLSDAALLSPRTDESREFGWTDAALMTTGLSGLRNPIRDIIDYAYDIDSEGDRKALAQEMLARREDNRGVATASELAGSLALPVPKGAKGMIGTGTAFGLGEALSEASLKNRDLTAEGAAASMAAGALSGGALAGVSWVGKKVLDVVGAKLIGPVLRKTSDEAMEYQLKRTAPSSTSNMTDYLDDLADGTQAYKKTMKDLVDVAKQIEFKQSTASSKTLQELNTAREQANILKSIAEKAQEELENDVLKLSKLTAGTGEYAALENKINTLKPDVESTIGIWTAAEDNVLQKNYAYRGEVNKPMLEELSANLVKHMEENGSRMSEAEKMRLSKANSYIISLLSEDKIRSLPADWSVKDIFKAFIGWGVGEAAASHTDLDPWAKHSIGALGAALGGSKLTGMAADKFVAPKLVEHGVPWMVSRGAKLLDEAALPAMTSFITDRVANVLSIPVGKAAGGFAVNKAQKYLGKWYQPLSDAYASGPEQVLSTHIHLASQDDGDKYLSKLGLYNETPEQMESFGSQVTGYTTIQRINNTQETKVTNAVNNVFKGVEQKYGSYDLDSYNAKLNRATELLNNPASLYEQVANGVPGMPGMSAQMGSKILDGAKFLVDRAPKNPYANMPPAIRPDWQPAQYQVQKWHKYAEAVENPLGAIEQMSAGVYSPEAKEVLLTVYPALYDRAKQEIGLKLSNLKEPLPYSKKVALSQLFGPEILNVNAAKMTILQSNFESAPKQEEVPRTPKISSIKPVDRTQELTKGQRLLSR